MSDPFTDYQRVVHRTSDLIGVLRYEYRGNTYYDSLLELLERKYAAIIADETYATEVRE